MAGRHTERQRLPLKTPENVAGGAGLMLMRTHLDAIGAIGLERAIGTKNG